MSLIDVMTTHDVVTCAIILTVGMGLLFLYRERKNAVKHAAVREAQQTALLAAAPDAVLRIEPSGQVILLNPQAEKLLEQSGVMSYDLLIQRIPGLRFEGDSGRERLRAYRTDGTQVPLDIAWSAYHPSADDGDSQPTVLMLARDISLREQIETRLRERDASLARAARVATAGELASALAHELNQPMTALIGYLRAARLIEQAEPRADTRLGATLGKAADEALRAADILRRLRDFYIGRGPKSENFDVRELIDGMLEEFSRRLTDKRITIHHEHATAVPLVYADRIYVEIVLSNLLNNAVEALHNREQPNIHVRTEIEPTRVVISVDDNGPGIAVEGAMIFKPFYTSKAEGMGLGLAMSRSLAESLGGSLRSASSLLGGARFELRLSIANPDTTAM